MGATVFATEVGPGLADIPIVAIIRGGRGIDRGHRVAIVSVAIVGIVASAFRTTVMGEMNSYTKKIKK